MPNSLWEIVTSTISGGISANTASISVASSIVSVSAPFTTSSIASTLFTSTLTSSQSALAVNPTVYSLPTSTSYVPAAGVVVPNSLWEIVTSTQFTGVLYVISERFLTLRRGMLSAVVTSSVSTVIEPRPMASTSSPTAMSSRPVYSLIMYPSMNTLATPVESSTIIVSSAPSEL